LLSRDFEKDDPRLKPVTKIQEGARSLNRVVNELLMFTRPVKLESQRVEISNVINGAIGFLIDDITKLGIRLQKRLGPAGLKISGDGEQLKRALLNIVLNAVQAMPNGGNLTISLPHTISVTGGAADARPFPKRLMG